MHFHKFYHLKLDIRWVLISFLVFFPGWGTTKDITLKIFQPEITVALL